MDSGRGILCDGIDEKQSAGTDVVSSGSSRYSDRCHSDFQLHFQRDHQTIETLKGFDGLDTKNKEELHALFFELRDQMNQTFVIVTHDEQLATNTDRVIHIRDGVVEAAY